MTAVDAPIAANLDGTRPSVSLERQPNGGGLATPSRDNDAMSMTSIADMEARCGGCRKLIEQEDGGVVVAFGYVSFSVILRRPMCCLA